MNEVIMFLPKILDERRKKREQNTIFKIVNIIDNDPIHIDAFKKASWKLNEIGMKMPTLSQAPCTRGTFSL